MREKKTLLISQSCEEEKTIKCPLLIAQTDSHTHKHTDILTYRLNLPRGPWSENPFRSTTLEPWHKSPASSSRDTVARTRESRAAQLWLSSPIFRRILTDSHRYYVVLCVQGYQPFCLAMSPENELKIQVVLQKIQSDHCLGFWKACSKTHESWLRFFWLGAQLSMCASF